MCYGGGVLRGAPTPRIDALALLTAAGVGIAVATAALIILG